MKAILIFDLPEEEEEFNNAVNGSNAKIALWDINEMFRSMLKHTDPDKDFKNPTEVVERLWERFREKIEENDLTL